MTCRRIAALKTDDDFRAYVAAPGIKMTDHQINALVYGLPTEG